MERLLNIQMYPSSFTVETRILRITKSLAEAGVFTDVLIVAAQRDRIDLPVHEKLDDARSVWRVPTRVARRGLVSKIVNTLEWSLRVLWGLRGREVACINVRTLSVLPLGILLKLIKRSKLVYDVHEIETETGEVTGVRRSLSKATEALVPKFADAVAVTSDMHGSWYERELGIPNVWVIRNYPYRRLTPPGGDSLLKTACGLAQADLLFLYQGNIAKPRGTDLLMRVFARLPEDRHIVFMGFGEAEDMAELMEYRRKHPNIHYHPTVPPTEVYRYTPGADVGLHMMDNSCVNHLYALPNKPMEYMNAGIPAIVSDLPQMGTLIREANAGWVVPVNDEHALEALVRRLTREEIEEKAAYARQWAATHTWDREEPKLHALYDSLGFAARSVPCSIPA